MTVLYQDESLVVCIKPAGLLSQADSRGGDSAVARLEAALGKIYPVHRLDRETGGVMVFARTQAAAAALSRAIQQDRLEKEYLAVLPALPARNTDQLTDLLFHDRTRNRTYVVHRLRKGAKEARLAYAVLEQRETGVLVRVRLLTGRTHQIRVQFASRQLPLLGDRAYGSRESCPMALWAWSLHLPHPRSGEMLGFSALPPAETAPWRGFSAWPRQEE